MTRAVKPGEARSRSGALPTFVTTARPPTWSVDRAGVGDGEGVGTDVLVGGNGVAEGNSTVGAMVATGCATTAGRRSPINQIIATTPLKPITISVTMRSRGRRG